MHPFKLLVNKVLRRSLMKSVLEILLSALNKNLDFTCQNRISSISLSTNKFMFQ